MKDILRLVGFCLMVGTIALIFAFKGYKAGQDTIEENALKYPQKECYTKEDINNIIYGTDSTSR